MLREILSHQSWNEPQQTSLQATLNNHGAAVHKENTLLVFHNNVCTPATHMLPVTQILKTTVIVHHQSLLEKVVLIDPKFRNLYIGSRDWDNKNSKIHQNQEKERRKSSNRNSRCWIPKTSLLLSQPRPNIYSALTINLIRIVGIVLISPLLKSGNKIRKGILLA